LITLIAFCAILYIIYRLVVRWQLARAAQSVVVDPLLSTIDLSIPTIVYFTTPMCAICRTTQRPAFERLRALMATVNIITVDATEAPDSSQRWGVLSVPTTFVLDASGTAVNVNNGFVDEHKLSAQLRVAHRLT
jgi:thiol-disulfide isomerase/thioredoxin